MPTVCVETESCHAPRLSSGRALSPVVGVDLRRKGTGDDAGTHPLGPPPEACSGYRCGCGTQSNSSGRYAIDTHHTCLDQGRDLSVGEADLTKDLVGVGAGF